MISPILTILEFRNRLVMKLFPQNQNSVTPLIASANNGHAKVCELLLGANKAGLEETETYGLTALNVAALRGHINVVALLLSKEARVDSRDSEGFTPLLRAAQQGYTEVCELLLNKGKADSEETEANGQTALKLAATNGHASTVAMLLLQGAKVDTRDQKGITPFLASAHYGHTAVCELLLETGKVDIEDKTPLGDTALNIAATNGHVNTLVLLLSKGARVDTVSKDGFTPLLVAVLQGHFEMYGLLLNAGKADVNIATSLGVLRMAAAKGQINTVALLLSKGAKVDTRDKDGFTPLLAAAQKGKTEACELLLETGKADLEDTDQLGNTALNLAALNGHASTVSLLLSKGARMNTKNNNDYTPFASALWNGQSEVCKLLLDTNEASLNERIGDTTLLMLAISLGHLEVCELLMNRGSSLEERDPVTLDTALHEAALRGDQILLQLLLSYYKGEVNLKNRIGFTPLHYASQEGHMACVMTLLQAGADPLIPDDIGVLPIHLAAQFNRSEVVRTLIEEGRCCPDQVRHI